MATSTRISPDSVRHATNSLITWKSTKSTTEPQNLLPDEDFLYLILTLKNIPTKSRLNPYKLPLPHPVHLSSETELCLIIDDRQTSNLTEADVVKKIEKDGIQVDKVLEYSKLKSDYVAFEAKRKLCDSFDMFLVDKRIVNLLPKLIGKVFYKKRKIPMSINLEHKNWKEQIERAIGSGLLFLRTGTSCAVKVVRVEMDVEEIVENVMAAVDRIVEIVPKKWDGIRSFHLKVSESVSLPIYQALPDLKLKISGVERVEEEVVDEGEISDAAVKDEKVMTKKKGSKKGKALNDVRLLDVEKTDFSEDVDMGSEDDNDDGYVAEEAPVKKRKKSTDMLEKAKPKKKVSSLVEEDTGEKKSKKVVKPAKKEEAENAKDKVSTKKIAIKKLTTEGTNLKDKKRSRVAK